jgi:hypothetical protein
MPTTLGAILLLLAVFASAIAWATRGETDRADKQGDVTGHPGKTS